MRLPGEELGRVGAAGEESSASPGGGERGLPFAGYLVTSLTKHVTSQLNAIAPPHRAEAVQTGCMLRVCRSENSRGGEVWGSLGEVWEGSIGQTAALVSGETLLTSSTIYISDLFSCKLHASTLTKTKDRTISYRQIQVR